MIKECKYNINGYCIAKDASIYELLTASDVSTGSDKTAEIVDKDIVSCPYSCDQRIRIYTGEDRKRRMAAVYKDLRHITSKRILLLKAYYHRSRIFDINDENSIISEMIFIRLMLLKRSRIISGADFCYYYKLMNITGIKVPEALRRKYRRLSRRDYVSYSINSAREKIRNA